MHKNRRAFRASILHFLAEPDATGRGLEYFEDGLLLVEDGKVKQVSSASQMAADGFDLRSAEHFLGQLLLPGFIDTHVHLPQVSIIASYGEQLLDWLNNYTFPAELRFADADYAQRAAEQFVQLLLQHGTTSAMVYTSVFAQSTQAFFAAAQQRQLRMIAGKVLMDRHAPAGLLDTATTGTRDSRALIEAWHGRDRLAYALTPRFAPTSTPAQLAAIGRLYREYPGVYLQTHLSENLAELAWVQQLFPQARNYLDVYDRYGLLGPRSVFGHGIHLREAELVRLAQTQSVVAFCPSSNLFLGSGLLDLARLRDAGVRHCLATDVGAGTSLSLLRTLADAYKVLQLQGQKLHPFNGFYQVTLGNARALQLDAHLGNFAAGKEADFIVIDKSPSLVQQQRQANCKDLAESLFALMMMGDELNIARTYILGELAYQRP